jgi:hypothetical protein
MIGRAERHGEDGDGPKVFERFRAAANPASPSAPPPRPASSALLNRIRPAPAPAVRKSATPAICRLRIPSAPPSVPQLPRADAAGVTLPAPFALHRPPVGPPALREQHARVASGRRAADLPPLRVHRRTLWLFVSSGSISTRALAPQVLRNIHEITRTLHVRGNRTSISTAATAAAFKHQQDVGRRQHRGHHLHNDT